MVVGTPTSGGGQATLPPLITPRDPSSAGQDSTLVVGAPPVDYSFKELKSCGEIETEEPRTGGRRRPGPEKEAALTDGAAVGDATVGGATGSGGGLPGVAPNSARGGAGLNATSGAVGAKGPGMKKMLRKVTHAVRLNNNLIDSVQDLPQALTFIMEDPSRNLRWLDLSFNNLKAIEPMLLQLQNLKALYMHGNKIRSLPSVEQLKKLPKLISLTLNGNPIENARSYRAYIIGAVPQLRTLDHSSITEVEVKEVGHWFQAHLKRARVRKDKKEQEYLDSLNE